MFIHFPVFTQYFFGLGGWRWGLGTWGSQPNSQLVPTNLTFWGFYEIGSFKSVMSDPHHPLYNLSLTLGKYLEILMLEGTLNCNLNAILSNGFCNSPIALWYYFHIKKTANTRKEKIQPKLYVNIHFTRRGNTTQPLKKYKSICMYIHTNNKDFTINAEQKVTSKVYSYKILGTKFYYIER